MKKILLLCLLLLSAMTIKLKAQLFYKIEGSNLSSPSYIFGSHHLAPLRILEDASVENYFKETKQVVGELDLTKSQMEIALALQPHMLAPTDSTLSVLLAGEDMERLNEQFQKWSLVPGLTLEMLDNLKPMAVTTMIAVGLNSQVMPEYNPNEQIDSYFFKEGEKEGKTLIGLETPEFQGEVLFDMTPLVIQADDLKEILKNPEEAVSDAKRLTEAYFERDLDEMLALSKEAEESREFMENILYKRNQDWLTKLPSIMETSPSFIVVGALHLAGPKGIIEGLKQQGYTISPLY